MKKMPPLPQRPSPPKPIEPRQAPQTPWQPRFGIRELLMLMLIGSMLAAALGYLYQDERNGGRSMRFIFLTVAGPTLMATVLGISFICYEFFRSKKRKKKRGQSEEAF